MNDFALFRIHGITVYNCCTGQQNPITWKKFVYHCFDSMRKNPIGDVSWYPDGKCRSNWITNSFFSFTLHVLPAYIIDILGRVAGKKPM